MEGYLLQVIVVVISLVFSAFFSGMEIAFVSANKFHIEIEKKKEDFVAVILSRLTEKPSKFIATMLLGNNIALVVYGYFMGDLLQSWMLSLSFEGYMQWVKVFFVEMPLLSQTILSTLVILLTAEFLPKVFFQIYANTLVKVLAPPAYFFYVLFSLVSNGLIKFSDFVLHTFFKTKGDDVQLAFTKVELGNYISEQMEAVTDEDKVDTEIQIFQNALEFSGLKSRAVMIPRTEIVAVAQHISPRALTDIFIESGLSKILIYKDTIDDIVGYVHSYDLFKKPKTISSVLNKVVYVPETMLINDVLGVLTKRRKSIAVVIDEYGGTSGMMTVEDIIEELFGEIEDEHDTVDLLEVVVEEDKCYHFSARHEVDYLNEHYRLMLPESDQYETLGGLIVSHTEEIPQEGERVDVGGLQLLILKTSSTKVELVEVSIVSED